jgi:hypothetical protein
MRGLAALPGNEDAARGAKGTSERVGVIHVHSSYSDGTGGMEAILAAARRAALDFVILTDHDTTAARREGWGGQHEGVTVIVGAEVTPLAGPHCLALGMRDCLGFARMDQDTYLDRISRAGGFVAVAHPLGRQRPELGIVQRAWTSWHHPAIQALEVWNYMHDWVSRIQAWKLHELYRLIQHAHTGIGGPEPRALALWDRLARRRRIAGICGLDCHARRFPLTDVELFPYEEMFRTVRTHLFVPDGDGGERGLLQALRLARGFIANDFLADSRGARFWGECECGSHFALGESHACEGRPTLRVVLPQEAAIRLLRDGSVVARGGGRAFEAVVQEPGAYRFEAHLPPPPGKSQPWIFSNHIYLRRSGNPWQ